MARLCVKASPQGNVRRYELLLEGVDEDFIGPDGTGCVDLPDNNCGDGSEHVLKYALFGEIGAKLNVKLFCDGHQIRNYDIEIFPPGGEMQGDARFRL